MADIHKTEAVRDLVHAGAQGNAHMAHEQRNLNGAENGDLVYFVRLPRGSMVFDGLFTKTGDDAGAGATMKLGLVAAKDGALGDDDYFNAAKALDGGNVQHRKDAATAPLYLEDDDYFVVGTIGGANVGDNDVLVDAVINYEYQGNL